MKRFYNPNQLNEAATIVLIGALAFAGFSALMYYGKLNFGG